VLLQSLNDPNFHMVAGCWVHNSIHPKQEKAFQELDAAVFSGDALDHADFRARFSYFLERWRGAIVGKIAQVDKARKEVIRNERRRRKASRTRATRNSIVGGWAFDWR